MFASYVGVGMSNDEIYLVQLLFKFISNYFACYRKYKINEHL